MSAAAADFAAAWKQHQAGRLAEAERLYRAVLAKDDGHAQAWYLLGVVRWQQGDGTQAEQHLRQALQRRPNLAAAHNFLGMVLASQRRHVEAASHFREAVRLQPNDAEAHSNLGLALLDAGDHSLTEAESNLREAIRLRADFADAHNNLGNVLWRQGRLPEARAAALKALQLRPDYAEAHNMLGSVCLSQGHLQEALLGFERAIKLKPNFAEAHFNRSVALLVLGRWEEGWAEYEWRWKLPVPRRDFRQPLWDGSPLQGRTIVLHAEQGLGDTLNFIRYAALVKGRGGRVVVSAPRPLLPLLAGCRGIDRLAADGDPLPDFDVHAPMLSLPRLFGTRPDSIPADVPYLHVDPQNVYHWRLWLTGYPGFKVGIAWQGDPKKRNDRQRSVPLTRFARLAQVPSVQLFSLQRGAGSEQLDGCPFPVTDLGRWQDKDGRAFLDTAAVMRNLDLVVCVDTAVGHLAGGLGVPVWLALPFDPDWRWLRERTDSPWYPTMRLFRQPHSGDWDSVFAQIAAELHRQVDTQSP
jgi:Flp pilus assembly protein TadD